MSKKHRIVIHYLQSFGMKLCAQTSAPGESTDDPLSVSCGLCRRELHKRGIPTTKTHFGVKTGALCKIQNDGKRVSDILVDSEIANVTCGNCKSIARRQGLVHPRVMISVHSPHAHAHH